GVVEIKAVAREPGHRSKIAVVSNDKNVDPVGACVGAKGSRVRMVMNELRGEKIDIIKWTDDLQEFVANALSPAKVREVRILDEGQTALVVVPDHQLSLAIGKEGQNARLAARLTGLRVDIKSESQMRADTQAADAESAEPEPAAEAAEAEVPAPAGPEDAGDSEPQPEGSPVEQARASE
ncbi:MAG: transcription termination/antitermination protein NusA, partial [Actinomycetota bacterium]